MNWCQRISFLYHIICIARLHAFFCSLSFSHWIFRTPSLVCHVDICPISFSRIVAADVVHFRTRQRDDFQLSHWIVELNLSETDVSTFFPLRAFLFGPLCTLICCRFITFIVLGNLYYSRCHPGVVQVCVCVWVYATLCANKYTGSGAVRRPVFVCHDICIFGKRRSQR